MKKNIYSKKCKKASILYLTPEYYLLFLFEYVVFFDVQGWNFQVHLFYKWSKLWAWIWLHKWKDLHGSLMPYVCLDERGQNSAKMNSEKIKLLTIQLFCPLLFLCSGSCCCCHSWTSDFYGREYAHGCWRHGGQAHSPTTYRNSCHHWSKCTTVTTLNYIHTC